MTLEEVQKKSKEKIKMVQTLADQLQIKITAEQKISDEGFIKTMVFFVDMEKYPQDEPKKEDDKNTTVREEKTNN